MISIRMAIVFILRTLYSGLISPAIHLLAGPGFGCRFKPTCSQVFFDSVNQLGWLKGSAKGLNQLARCHPFGK